MKLKGIIKGKTIELLEKPKLPEGVEVEIEVTQCRNKDKVDRSLFGIWKGRKEFKNSSKWVDKLRSEDRKVRKGSFP